MINLTLEVRFSPQEEGQERKIFGEYHRNEYHIDISSALELDVQLETVRQFVLAHAKLAP